MFVIEGIPTSPGYARGNAIVYDFELGRQIESVRSELLAADVEQEWRRLDQAVQLSQHDLHEVADNAGHVAQPTDVLTVLAAHAALTAEIAILVKKKVDHNLVNVEQALDIVINDWSERLSRLDSEYLRQRELDVRDVGRRLKRYLAGSLTWRCGPAPEGAVVVARELMPTEVVELANCNVAALVSERGGRYSHTTILARSLGLPAVTRVLHATSRIQPGTPVLVDGETGLIVVEPLPADEDEFYAKQTAFLRALETRFVRADTPSVTLDGVRVEIHANVGRPPEIAAVVKQRLDGVGLFRTEFLFMEAQERPELRLQATVYSTMAQELEGRPLVVRTFDLGREKTPPFLLRDSTPDDAAILLNGLRFSLAERDLFETQIAAVLDAAQTEDVRILLPMVIGGDDFSQAVTRIEQIAERYDLARTPMIGAMIETPAALFGLEEILDRADFLALGTNDLTQFLLATDRDVVDLVDDCTAMHPAVLRAIHRVCEAATRRQCPVSVCGEAASEADFACLMIGMGVKELSVDPSRAPALRQAIQSLDSQEAKKLANDALTCQSPAEVGEVVLKWRHRMQKVHPCSAQVGDQRNASTKPL